MALICSPLPQPHQFPACCLATEGRLLVGGAPLGVAFTLDDGANWQASWMDYVDNRVVALAADPRVQETGVLLAGSEGGGVLRSFDRGRTWKAANYGLHNYQVLALAWAPPAPQGAWPAWEVAFAGTEDGLYRSPNGGRAWKRSEGVHGVVLGVAAAPDFHSSGVVLVGTEENGLWRSTDGGHCFTPVTGRTATDEHAGGHCQRLAVKRRRIPLALGRWPAMGARAGQRAKPGDAGHGTGCAGRIAGRRDAGGIMALVSDLPDFTGRTELCSATSAGTVAGA